jgi:hypothetical protein
MNDQNDAVASAPPDSVEAAYAEVPVDVPPDPPVVRTPVVLNTTTPVQLEEVDFLKYQLLLTRVQKAQLVLDMYRREIARAEVELAEHGKNIGQHTRSLAEKYAVDFRAMMISDDGYFIPRPQQ